MNWKSSIQKLYPKLAQLEIRTTMNKIITYQDASKPGL